MYKRGIAMLLTLALLLGMTTMTAAGVAADPLCQGEEATPAACANSDLEATAGDVTWYVDNLDTGRILTARPETGLRCAQDGGVEIAPLTDWAAEQLLLWQGKLYASRGAELLCLDPETGTVLESDVFDAPLARFAFGPRGRYVLAEGRICGPDGERIGPEGVRSFWLESGDKLCYLTGDGEAVHELDLAAGRESLRPNLASDLGDAPLYTAPGMKRGAGLLTLKQKFPPGKYWNHMPNLGTGPSVNNQDGWTDIPCPKHNNYCGTSRQSCNGFDPDGNGELTWQCYGYAEKCGFDVTGRSPENGLGWKMLWYSAALDSLKAGDIIRYKRNGLDHSIYVTAVSGDTITFTDCNYDGTCVIRWNQTVAKSTVKATFQWLHSAPSAAPQEPSWTLTVKGLCNGEERSSLQDFGSFDLWIDGEEYRTGCDGLQDSFPVGASYELRNIQAAPGILYGGVVSGEPEGTLEGNRCVVLRFDRCVEGDDGSQIVMPFTDLPDPKNWAYKPICWAVAARITGGMTETSFAPSEPCTRAQSVTFLWRAAGKPAPEQTEHPFTDLKEGSFYARSVLWALEQGITKGKTDTEFRPGQTCSRGEIVTFLWRAAGKPAARSGENPFRDVETSSYCYRAVLWAAEQGIVKGMEPEMFCPSEPCTRAQVVTFLYRWAALRE